jgi:hypothetical protein
MAIDPDMFTNFLPAEVNILADSHDMAPIFIWFQLQSDAGHVFNPQITDYS